MKYILGLIIIIGTLVVAGRQPANKLGSALGVVFVGFMLFRLSHSFRAVRVSQPTAATLILVVIRPIQGVDTLGIPIRARKHLQKKRLMHYAERVTMAPDLTPQQKHLN